MRTPKLNTDLAKQEADGDAKKVGFGNPQVGYAPGVGRVVKLAVVGLDRKHSCEDCEQHPQLYHQRASLARLAEAQLMLFRLFVGLVRSN